MGIYNNGPYSGFSGRVGNLVGSTWRDKEVMRTRPKYRRNRKKSPAQEAQQAKFSMAAKLTGYLSNLIKESYGKADRNKANNKAYQEILQSVIGGVYPNLTIDYSKLPVAKGIISKAWNPAADSLVPGRVKFTWEDSSLFLKADPNDLVLLVVFCEEVGELLYASSGALRSDREDEMNISLLSGKEVHTWISFFDSNKEFAANSVYTGVVTVL